MRLNSEERPKLSVVIAAFNNSSSLKRCLTSLNGQGESLDTEVIVVSNYGEGGREMIGRQFSHVRYFHLSAGTTVPELRAHGIRHARGDIVALAEDHCTFDKNWCSEIRKAHELSYPVIGGSVENASCKSLLDWAVYFYEYGRYMLPDKGGVVNGLSGNNVSYKRTLLIQLEESFKKGFFETFIHRELKRGGKPLFLVPSAIVYHTKNYKIREAFIQCYHHGRSFGGMRISNAPLLKRMVFVLCSVTLPVLLPSRIALKILKKGRHIKELLFSFPYLFLLMVSWSYGEFCGYLFGGGKSSARWA